MATPAFPPRTNDPSFNLMPWLVLAASRCFRRGNPARIGIGRNWKPASRCCARVTPWSYGGLTGWGPGYAVYAHERIGENGRPFRCYKFRTMYKDAEEKLQEILSLDEAIRTEWENNWKLRDDPRITKIGKFLRKTSLDELPQIFNVMKGEMSVVGPRPYLPREKADIDDNIHIITSAKPGITGLWQVSGRSNTGYRYRIKLDTWYVMNWSLWLDIVIILKTIKVVLKAEGAY